jgi:NAD(P)-dependent dehydrogenase (short-subunit alcohol dehydrogenase family)
VLVNLTASSLFCIKDKIVVLTGASGFLGSAFAETLLSNGAKLIVLGRSEKLDSHLDRWQETFGPNLVYGYRLDMHDADKLQEVLEEIANREKRIDVLVNNAHELGPQSGFNTSMGSLENCTVEQWTRNLAGGVIWPMLATQILGEKMKAQNGGSIINICTMYAVVAPSPDLYEGTDFLNPPGYSASKAAMLGFTRYVASFWGKYSVRANAILPGPFSNTDYTGANSVQPDSPFIERLKSRTCLKRVGRPHELAGALLFLASDASSFMTGQPVIVDGGWTAI